MSELKQKEFLGKLKNLLEEYSVSIDWECSPGSDLHGVYDMQLVLLHRPDPKSWKEVEWFSTNNSTTISASDL